MRKGAFLSLLFLSCATHEVFLGTSVRSPILMTDVVDREYTVVKHFRRTTTASWLFAGTFTLSRPEMDRILSEELRKAHGDAIINLRITSRVEPMDGCISGGLELGLNYLFPPYSLGSLLGYERKTIILEGDIVRWK